MATLQGLFSPRQFKFKFFREALTLHVAVSFSSQDWRLKVKYAIFWLILNVCSVPICFFSGKL